MTVDASKAILAKMSGDVIRFLTLDDVAKAIVTLKDSFKNDALDQYLFSHVGPKEQDAWRLLFYSAYVKQHIAKGICLGINESIDAFETVAVWSTPSSEGAGLESFDVMMDAGYGDLFDAIDKKCKKRIFSGLLRLLHEEFNGVMTQDVRFFDKKVFTLVYVGTTKAAAGKGNVRKMFEYMFSNFIDIQANTICYLESSSKANIPIYKKFGFNFYEDIFLGDKGDSALEGRDFCVMNVMIRGVRGEQWNQKKLTNVKANF